MPAKKRKREIYQSQKTPLAFLYLFQYNRFRKDVIFMVAVNFSTLRNNLKAYCDTAARDAETIIVTRKNDDNVVMMSLESYNNLMENMFLMSSKKNYQHILDGIQQLKAGHVTAKTNEELEQLLHE